jgi:hypothetical protein
MILKRMVWSMKVTKRIREAYHGLEKVYIDMMHCGLGCSVGQAEEPYITDLKLEGLDEETIERLCNDAMEDAFQWPGEVKRRIRL